jgi:excinuclease UvrABC nuclease subunit
MSNTVKWLSHEFGIFPHNAAWNEVGGVYIFCGVNSKNEWQPYYIGKTDNFRNRIISHEKWQAAVQLGATHVHAMTVLQETSRDQIEKQLIDAWKPPLNVQNVVQ